MHDLLPVSIGLGLAVSLMFSELFGLAAGGMVVPGYFALYLHRPLEVAFTLGVGVVAFALVHLASLISIIYGRRRTVLMILVGFLLGGSLRNLPPALIDSLEMVGARSGASDVGVIGFIIPGLIAIWIDRQGLVETISVLLTASVIVRLILILFVGLEINP
jgi:poly-gamma-glutamate biosynthesis protein PgsC/CapC